MTTPSTCKLSDAEIIRLVALKKLLKARAPADWRITEGCKYALWAVYENEGLTEDEALRIIDEWQPDHYYMGLVMNKRQLVLMWVPYFN